MQEVHNKSLLVRFGDYFCTIAVNRPEYQRWFIFSILYFVALNGFSIIEAQLQV